VKHHLYILVALTLLALAGCGKVTNVREQDLVVRGDATADAANEAPDRVTRGVRIATARLVFITHGQASDEFWKVVQRGKDDAHKQTGAAVSYRSPDAFSIDRMRRYIDEAVADHPDGLIVSLPDAKALAPSIKAAVKAGIPVITINSGSAKSKQFGAMAHVGQEEGIAGEQAGVKLKEAGKTKLLCVIHEAGNVGLTERCDGAKRGFGAVQTLQVDLNNPADVESRIKAALQADASIDAVLSLNPQVGVLAVSAAKGAGGKAQVATFDLNGDVAAAIKSGDILFAVDQQQYEQGYLPVVMLKLFVDNANTVGGGSPVLTGPGFVDKSNVDKVAEYAARGTR
jgi:simple sugar transport system substrate-binding protein